MLKELAVSLLLVTTVVSYSVRSEGVEHHELLPLNLLNNDDPIEDEESISHPIILNDEIREKRQIKKDENKLWTNGILNYYFSDSLLEYDKEMIKKAMKFISENTCIEFKENRDAEFSVNMEHGSCLSTVGMTSDEQYLSYGEYCEGFGSAVHELMHSLGIHHTMARYDRDDYVRINTDSYDFNIKSKKETYNAVPYEYESTMHYSYGNGKIDPKDESYKVGMGHRMPTFYDVQMINDAYNCFCEPKREGCANGGYLNPNDCKTCICPIGFGGPHCDQLPENGILLEATDQEQKWEGSWGPGTDDLQPEFSFKVLHIKAPNDTTIEVYINKLENADCNYTCRKNGIEVKYLADPRISNPFLCCLHQLYVPFKSKLNPTPIVLFSRYQTQNVSISYQYTRVPNVGIESETNGFDSYEYKI
ncbi:unnamed protein product [Caenorhabditis bovis]|uniref:Zinc metalloproteinase n=1 Tax=Caenorhabditis bovis TaxID=2654633 RepID=A0A8S1F248_9PELO|nr:unnamed protein product [Caenorhabditis bovis]